MPGSTGLSRANLGDARSGIRERKPRKMSPFRDQAKRTRRASTRGMSNAADRTERRSMLSRSVARGSKDWVRRESVGERGRMRRVVRVGMEKVRKEYELVGSWRLSGRARWVGIKSMRRIIGVGRWSVFEMSVRFSRIEMSVRFKSKKKCTHLDEGGGYPNGPCDLDRREPCQLVFRYRRVDPR